jgi:phosphoribosyl 1,2-cyclic phosphodiesterase
MRVTVLGSGSSGNSILVQAGDTSLLVDAGFSGKELERRLGESGVLPHELSGLLITHDHGDHTRGMGVLARRWGLPLYLTERTHRACTKLLRGDERVRYYRGAEPLQLGSLRVDPFVTVHDAADPLAVTVTECATGEKLGIATDLGRPTKSMRHALAACDMLILEANHDEILLRESPYPWSVKARIGSSHGHLSNRAAAELLGEIFDDRLGTVVLAHLSDNANDPFLARDVVARTLDRCGYRGRLAVAQQDKPLEPVDVASVRRRMLPPQLALF